MSKGPLFISGPLLFPVSTDAKIPKITGLDFPV
jgi:hypothetical protein